MATFGDLQIYLDRAPGWAREPNLARGRRRTGDHIRYSKLRPDGSRQRTKVSQHPREEIGDDLFKEILRDQLQVTEQEFWRVVRGRGTAEVVEPAAPPVKQGLPAWLVTCLIEVVGLPEDEVLVMSAEEAQTAWDAHRSKPRD